MAGAAEGSDRCAVRHRPYRSGMSRLLILDLSNMTHRAIHGYPPLTDPLGRPVQGAHGAGATALRLIHTYRPTHVAAACDTSRAGLLRKEWWPAYKEHRASGDDTVRHQLAAAAQVMRFLGIPCVGVDRWEADDVCASYAATFPGKVIIGTGDKDMFASVSERVRVHLLGKDILVGDAECAQIMGVRPDQVCDYKTLVGDSSDGFPGVPGIGAKGALALLHAHGTLEAILTASAAGQIAGRAARALEAGVEIGRVCHRLATLNTDLAVPALAPWRLEHDLAQAGLTELGLAGLIRRLPSAPELAAA